MLAVGSPATAGVVVVVGAPALVDEGWGVEGAGGESVDGVGLLEGGVVDSVVGCRTELTGPAGGAGVLVGPIDVAWVPVLVGVLRALQAGSTKTASAAATARPCDATRRSLIAALPGRGDAARPRSGRPRAGFWSLLVSGRSPEDEESVWRLPCRYRQSVRDVASAVRRRDRQGARRRWGAPEGCVGGAAPEAVWRLPCRYRQSVRDVASAVRRRDRQGARRRWGAPERQRGSVGAQPPRQLGAQASASRAPPRPASCPEMGSSTPRLHRLGGLAHASALAVLPITGGTPTPPTVSHMSLRAATCLPRQRAGAPTGMQDRPNHRGRRGPPGVGHAVDEGRGPTNARQLARGRPRT